MSTHYIGHDQAYQQLRAAGAFGWTPEADQTQIVQPRILQIITQLAIPSGGRILDLGCGTGDIAIWLAQQGYTADGIDIAPTAITWATEKATAQQTSVQFTVGSVLALLPYPDDFFHLVVDGRCLHCIIGSDRAQVLASVYRVLQPGGGFLVQTMCGNVLPASAIMPTFDPASRCTMHESGIATRYIGQAPDIIQELQTAGFQSDDWEIIPRQSEDDQDDLLVRAIKPS